MSATVIDIRAKFTGRCSHCGARINAGKVIVKTAVGKWIHASCPKDVPLAPEQKAIRIPLDHDEPDTDRIWREVDMGIRKLDGGNTERARRGY